MKSSAIDSSFDRDPITRFEYNGVKYKFISDEGYTYRSAKCGCALNEERKFNNELNKMPSGLNCVSIDPIPGYERYVALERIWNALVPDTGSELVSE